MRNKPPDERFQRKYQLLKKIILMEQKFIIFMQHCQVMSLKFLFSIVFMADFLYTLIKRIFIGG